MTKGISPPGENLFPRACLGSCFLQRQPALTQLSPLGSRTAIHPLLPLLFDARDESRSAGRATLSPKHAQHPHRCPAQDGLSHPHAAPSAGGCSAGQRWCRGAAGTPVPRVPGWLVHKLTLTGSDGCYETAAVGKAPAGHTCPSPLGWQRGTEGAPARRGHGSGDRCLTPPVLAQGQTDPAPEQG